MKKILPLLIAVFTTVAAFGQNSAIHFDGIDDYIPITGHADLSGPDYITLETWIYVDNFNSSPCANCAPIIWHQANSYRFGTGNGAGLELQLNDGSATKTLAKSSGLNANKWHHIAGTFDGSEMKLYVDGVCTDSLAATFTIYYKNTSDDIWIVDPATGYGGVLDETRIWDYARSAAQIKQGMYRKYPPTTSGLLLQLSYEDGQPYQNNTSVTTVVDNTSLGNDGAPGNFAMKDSTSNFVIGRSFCDSTVYGKLSVKACDKYTAPSKKWFTSKPGTYSDTIMSVNGCDSVITITVDIIRASSATFNYLVCDSLMSPTGKVVYRKSGKYQEKIRNSVGCDSIMTINVVVTKKDTTFYSYDACYQAVTKGKGRTITSSGLYIDTFKAWGGCDSFVYHTVKIRKASFANRTLGFCNFVVCPTNKNKVFYADGIFYDTIVNKQGCDSIIAYNVVSASTNGVINMTTCKPVKSPSKKYNWTQSGQYKDTIFGGNKANCDSFITANIVFLTPIKTTLNETGCEFYISPSGKKITTSGTANDIILSKSGCDSIIYTINLTIVKIASTISRDWNTLSSESSTGAYQWLDCKKSFETISGETNKSYTPVGNGEFAVEITDGGCVDTSRCYVFAKTAVNSLESIEVSLKPNPNNGQFIIQSQRFLGDVELSIVNAQGQIVYQTFERDFKDKVIDLQLSAGIYQVQIVNIDGRFTGKIIVE